ncbi:hypothetical protein [Falsiporphyromonas endometrii]|uniref:Uncharacterized protein n=1 Tax=Falsiporphyromonas endometrii TaxID=1387297 RepID=A0ABV9K825_9PORP
METVILLTILLIVILLGGGSLQAGKVCSISSEQIAIEANIKINHTDCLLIWAVKLTERIAYLLNIIVSHNTQKGALTDLIHTQIHTFRG